MIFHQPTQPGFTLVETLVAISILLIVIVGPMQISSSAARSTSYSSEQVVAFFLAQEGAEIAQKARDDYILQGLAGGPAGWDAFKSAAATCYGGCGLRLNTDVRGSVATPVSCASGGCQLYFNTAVNTRARYTHTAGGNIITPYTRVVTFTNVSSEEIRVQSRVYWRTNSQRQVQEAVVETYLFNVYDN